MPGGIRDRSELHEIGGVPHTPPPMTSTNEHRFGYVAEQFPNAYWVGERTVSIPLTQKLTDREVERVISAVRGILS